MINQLESKLGLYITDYENTHKHYPTQAIVNTHTLETIKSILTPHKKPKGSYSGYSLKNGKDIKFHLQEKISKTKQEELKEKTEDMTHPIIFCTRKIKNFQNPKSYDLSLPKNY